MNAEISKMLLILLITIFLLIFEIIRIDLAAMVCMLSLGWTGILTTNEMLLGFSSNAVIVMIAVMIMGRGIDKAGIMDLFSTLILEKVGNERVKIIAWMSLAVGILSGFVQNIGAIVLFLPSILNISRRSRIPKSQLIMPIGFAAILGGTLTMVGSGPLVLINDLLINAGLKSFGMFSVTPIGILLLLSGIGYFLLFGKKVLPGRDDKKNIISNQEELIQKLHLPDHVWHFAINDHSPLVGKTAEDSGIWKKPMVNILAIVKGGELEYSPWRKTIFEAGQEIALLGAEDEVREFAQNNQLIEPMQTSKFGHLLDPKNAGFAEVIVPNRSELAGKTIQDYSIRKRFGVEPILLFSQGEEIKGDISDHVVKPGDTIIVFGLWERIDELKASVDFVVASPAEPMKAQPVKSLCAMICFTIAIGLAVSGLPVSLAFLSGAVAMVLTGTLSIQEMYQSIEWKVVFLLAGLIPLGIAMQKSGTAEFLAENMIAIVLGKHPLLIVMIVGILATLFSLFMTNVGATVMLAPIVIEMARIGNFDPRPMVLMAAVCAANSFIIPTHQVNALIMSPGGYRNQDYFKAGIGMTLVFLIIAVLYFYLLFMRA
jgi:di/tricarboxylate transporter